MAILYPERFAQAKPAGFDGVFNWDFLDGCFGKTIRPMDFDGVVERHSNFLIFETKDEGVEIPFGQALTLKNLVLLGKGKITVFHVVGKNETLITQLNEWHYVNGDLRIVEQSADANFIRRRCCDWFEKVNGGKSKEENTENEPIIRSYLEITARDIKW